MKINRPVDLDHTAMASHNLDCIGPQGTAIVVACRGRDVDMAQNGTVHSARVAFGCLVAPEPGDRVLTARADGTIWVISVLERHAGGKMRLLAEGDLTIASSTGEISLMAGQVSIDAPERIRLAASEIDLHAGIGRLVIDELLQIGRRANLYVGKIRYVCEQIESFADHVLTRVQRSSRFVEESDQVRAGDIDHRAEGTLQTHARTMLMTADNVVRVDAEQIHMG